MTAKPREVLAESPTRSTVGEVCSVIKTVVWGAVAIVGLFMFKDCIVALAGKQTAANIVLNFLVDFKVSIAWAIAGGSAIFAQRERKLRQNTVARLEGRIHELETDVDPNRTSSHLTTKGKTNPGDIR